REDEISLTPFFALVAVAYLLVLGTELFYIKDIFGSRLNTVFKLYYQAWIMLAIAGAYGGYWLLREWRPAVPAAAALRSAWAGATALVLLGAVLYPAAATMARTNGLRN